MSLKKFIKVAKKLAPLAAIAMPALLPAVGAWAAIPKAMTLVNRYKPAIQTISKLRNSMGGLARQVADVEPPQQAAMLRQYYQEVQPEQVYDDDYYEPPPPPPRAYRRRPPPPPPEDEDYDEEYY